MNSHYYRDPETERMDEAYYQTVRSYPMIKDLKDCKVVVEKILEKNPAARDSDKLLMMLVWKEQGLKLSFDEELFWFDSCYHPESIRRTRQKFQELGLYPSKSKVKEEREFEEDAVKSEILDAENFLGGDLWDKTRQNGSI